MPVQELQPGDEVEVPGFRVTACRLSHPGGALGYRVASNGGGPVVAFVTDNELGPGGAERVPADWHATLTRFVGGASLLIHDAMYSPALQAERAGWGHSGVLEAVGLAAEASVKQLALFHHDPGHDDGQIDALLAMARDAAPAGLTVDAAREGWTVTL